MLLFKSALVYVYWSIKFPQHNINQSENGTGYKNLSVELLSIFFRKLITRSTLIICFLNTYVFENTFIKIFYINYSLFNRIWRCVCFKLFLLNQISVYLFFHRRNRYSITYQIYVISTIVTESNKCSSIFPPKKQILYYLPDLRG